MVEAAVLQGRLGVEVVDSRCLTYVSLHTLARLVCYVFVCFVVIIVCLVLSFLERVFLLHTCICVVPGCSRGCPFPFWWVFFQYTYGWWVQRPKVDCGGELGTQTRGIPWPCATLG